MASMQPLPRSCYRIRGSDDKHLDLKKCKVVGEKIEAELFKTHKEKWAYRQWCKGLLQALKDGKNVSAQLPPSW